MLAGSMEAKAKKAGLKASSFALALDQKSAFSKQNHKKRQLNIAQRFIIKSCLYTGFFYKAYRGIDLNSRKFVTIYIKPFSKQRAFSKNIKEELKQKIYPPLIWADTTQIDKNTFDVEVHTKFGPSLQQIMLKYKRKISDTTFFLLAYQILKLVDRVDNAGFVCRALSMKTVIVSENCLKHDMFFLNCFEIEKKHSEPSTPGDMKYCSIGTHLNLKTSSKDTVQSLCYILMDFYLQGKLFQISEQTEKEYLEAKSMYKPSKIPKLFVDFFFYVKSLNHNEQIRFTDWKRAFKKEIPQILFEKPYEWIKRRDSTEQKTVGTSVQSGFLSAFGIGSENKNQPEIKSSLLKGPEQFSLFMESKNQGFKDKQESKLRAITEKYEAEKNQSDEEFSDFQNVLDQIDECRGKENIESKVQQFQMDKLLESNKFFQTRHFNLT